MFVSAGWPAPVLNWLCRMLRVRILAIWAAAELSFPGAVMANLTATLE